MKKMMKKVKTVVTTLNSPTVYLIKADGTKETNPDNCVGLVVDDVKGIMVKGSNGHTVIVYPKFLKNQKIKISEGVNMLDKKHYSTPLDALNDYNGAANTEELAKMNSEAVMNLYDTLNDDWYIPACGELVMILSLADEINAFLKNIDGADMINRYESYWTSTLATELLAYYYYCAHGDIAYGKFQYSQGVIPLTLPDINDFSATELENIIKNKKS